MRKVGALVLGLIVVGLVGTVGLAQGPIQGDGEEQFKGTTKIIAKYKIKGVTKNKTKWESVGDAFGGVGNMITRTNFLSGTFTVTLGGPQTPTDLLLDEEFPVGPGLFTDTRLLFPFDPEKAKDNRVKLNDKGTLWSKVITDTIPGGDPGDPDDWIHFDMLGSLENTLGVLHSTTTPTEPFVEEPGKKSKEPLFLGGTFEIDTIKSKGVVKANKTFDKFKLKLSVKYTATVVGGEQDGKTVKGKLKIKMKKGQAVPKSDG